MTTKERIIIEALKLFSCDGYEGVSVRDIAKKLGMTQAALYKHYSSKKDIFDTIVKYMNEDSANYFNSLKIPMGTLEKMAEEYEYVGMDMVIDATTGMFNYWTQNEYASCFRKMLTLEKYRNKEMADLFNSYYVSGTFDFMVSLFTKLIETKYFKDCDARVMVMVFYAPVYFMVALYDETQDKDKITTMLKEHIKEFCNNYKL